MKIPVLKRRTRRLAIHKVLGALQKPGSYDRDLVVRTLAMTLDAMTPLELIPKVGDFLESATDTIWMPVAEMIVTRIEERVAEGTRKK